MITASPPIDLYPDAMAEREKIGVQEARDKFRERVDKAIAPGVHTVVSRHGRNVAVIVPIEWYRRASEALGEPTEY
jgi:prevent-host-death family protein